MTNSSCAFCFFSPLMALEKMSKSRNEWSRRERHGCVRQVHLCLRLLRHEPRAGEGTFCVILVREDLSCPDRGETLIFLFRAHRACTRSSLSRTESQPDLLLHTVWKEAMHPLHRRGTRRRKWPFLQDKVPPLLVQPIRVHCCLNPRINDRTQFFAMWFHGSTWRNCCVFLHNS